MDRSLQGELDRILASSLDDIVAGNPSLRIDVPRSADSWDIPSRDRMALARWGLPVMSQNPKSVHFKPDPQSSIEPGLSWDGGAAYRLGSYHYREVGVSVDDGVVVGVPQERQHLYPFLWFNGSVGSFVQIAWRWSLALPIFSLIEKAGEAGQLMDNLYRFPEYARSADPKIAQDERFQWWNEIADNW